MGLADRTLVARGARWGLWVLGSSARLWWLFGTGPRVWWRLFDDSKSSAFASVAVQTLAMIMTAAVARLLGEVEFGQLATLSTCIGWFAIISAYPSMTLIPRFVAHRTQEGLSASRQCASGFWLAIGFSSLATAAAVAFLPAGLAFYRVTELGRAGVMLSLQILAGSPMGVCLYLLQAHGRLRLWAVLNVWAAVLPLLAAAAAWRLLQPLTIERYVAAILAATALNGAVAVVMIVRVLGARALRRPDPRVIRPLLKAGLGGWVAGLCANFGSLGIGTMIAKAVGKTELGHYQLVLTIGAWVFAVVMSVTVPALSAWSADVARGRLRKLERSFRLRQAATGSLGALFALAAIAGAPRILALLYGPGYESTASLLRIGAVSWLALGLGCWYWIAFTALGHPGRIMLPNVAWGSLQLVIAWLLMTLTPLGVRGALVAYVVAYFCWLAVYELVLRRSLREARAIGPTRAGEEAET